MIGDDVVSDAGMHGHGNSVVESLDNDRSLFPPMLDVLSIRPTPRLSLGNIGSAGNGQKQTASDSQSLLHGICTECAENRWN